MISKFASEIVKKLIHTGAIKEEEKELYIYGFFVLLSKIVSVCIAIFSGILFGVLFESVVFCTMFILLRGYAGGFHSKNENICTVCTTIAFFIVPISIRLLYIADKPLIAIAILCVGTLNIALLGPIDTPEKPLTSEERYHYGKLTRLCLFAIFTASTISTVLHRSGILYAAAVCVSLESVLLLLALIRNEK